MFLPKQLTALHIDCEEVVGYTRNNCNLLWPAAGRDLVDNQRHEKVMHLAWLVVELDFPEQRCLTNGGRREQMLVLLPVRPLRIDAICEPVRSAQCETACGQSEEKGNFLLQFECSA